MMGSEQSQTMDSKRAKTPEEAFDRQMLSGNYMLFLKAALFLVVGVEMFIGLMPKAVYIGVASLIACLAAGFLAFPLFWEMAGNNNRFTRRLRRAAYFPIRTSAFIISKIKLMSLYGSLLWLISLGIQLVAGTLFGFGNILLYQGVLAVIFVINMVFYVVIGTVGAKRGE